MDMLRLDICCIVIAMFLVTHWVVDSNAANTTSNVALGKDATQTDTAGVAYGWLAVDGNPTTCSETLSAGAEWKLDLGDYVIVEEVSETKSESLWVSSVIKSSSEMTGMGSTYITGPNDNYVWLAENLQYVEVIFNVLSFYDVTRVDIHITNGAGSVNAIKCSVNGNWIALWSTTQTSITNGAQIFSPDLTNTCYSNYLRIEFKASRHLLWVDAIQVHGSIAGESAWVSSVVKTSSEEIQGWDSKQIIGPNDGTVFWMKKLHYVEVMFEKRVHVTSVDIYETSGAGSEAAIMCSVNGSWTTLWSTTPFSSSSDALIASPNLTTSCLTNFIRIEFQLVDHDLKVDAIRLHADKSPISVHLGQTQGLCQEQGIIDRSSKETWGPSDKGPYKYVRIQANPQQKPLKLCDVQVKGYILSRQPLFRVVKLITMSNPRMSTVSDVPSAITCAFICLRQTEPPCVTAQFDPERQSCAMFGGYKHENDNDDKNATIVFESAAHMFAN